MKLIDKLEQPYTDNERFHFIVKYNTSQYHLKSIEDNLYAYEYTQNELDEQNRTKLDSLSMTRGDMFEALILAFGKTKADIRKMIEEIDGLIDVERALYLNRFDEALDFYRGYPAVDLIGKMLGVSSEQLDKFFETKNYKELLSNDKPTEESEENNLSNVDNSIENEDEKPVSNGDSDEEDVDNFQSNVDNEGEDE